MYVQFTDSSGTAVTAVFANPQDAGSFPNQGIIEVSDARYAEYFKAVPPLLQPFLPAPE